MQITASRAAAIVLLVLATGAPAAISAETAKIVSFAHLPTSIDTIGVLAESAKVRVIRDAAATDITVASNCPRDWNITGSLIRQAGFTTARPGTRIKMDGLGHRAIYNGKIYPLAKTNGLSINSQGVMAGGEKVEPLEGSSVAGSCSDKDVVEITVPDSYTGNLILGADEGSEVALDSWKNGDIKCMMNGDAKLQAGKLTELSRAAIDLKGTCSAVIADISTKVLVTNIDGNGSLDIAAGSATITNATVSGAGSITMKGKFANLKQDVKGSGSIKVN